MNFNVIDIWTHILYNLDYKDIYNLRGINKNIVNLFENSLIKFVIKSIYKKYKHHINELMCNMINETVHAEGATIFFRVKDVKFKLYQKKPDGFNFLQDYQADLHFYCTDPHYYDDDSIELQKPMRQLLIAHQSPFNIDQQFSHTNLHPFNKEIYVQIDPDISVYLIHPSYEKVNEKHIYSARKYPVPENSDRWSDPDDYFRNDLGPLNNFWPMDTYETKTCEDYDITSDEFTQLLSHVSDRVDQYWIVSYNNLQKVIDDEYQDLSRYIFYKNVIKSNDHDNVQNILKLRI